MEIEKMGKAVSEALALQGKLESLQSQINELLDQISQAQKRIDDLTPLIKIRDTADNKRKKLQSDLDEVNRELTNRLKDMADEGIVLPLGEKSVNRQNRL